MTRELLLEQICPNACINNCRFIGCSQCNEKLNEILDEYDKHVIEKYKADTNLKDTIREIHDNVAQEMYCKGIDDMCTEISSYFTYGHCGNIIDVFEVAEKLKEQNK